MAEQSFRRDVTTPIPVPQVQAPDFNQNRSSVEDIADVASFGLQVFDRIEAGNREEQRQAIVADANSFVDKQVVTYLDILAQPNGSREKANAVTQRNISRRGIQSSFISEELAKRIRAVQLGVATDASGKDKPQPTAFEVASKPDQGMALAELDLTVVPEVGTPEREMLDGLVNRNTTTRVATQNAATAIANEDKETENQLDDLEVNHKKMLTNDTRASVIKATEMLEQLSSLPIGQQAEGFKEIRESMAILKGAMIDSTDSVYSGVTTEKGRERHNAALEQTNRLFKNFEAADDAMLENVMKQTNWLTNAKKLDLLSSGEIIPLVEALTGGKIMNEVFWTEIINTKEAGDTVLDTVAGIYNLSGAQRGALDIQTFAGYISGGGTIEDVSDIPLSDEGRASLFKNGFSFYKSITKDGKLGEMDDLDKGRASNAIINILNDSNSKDPSTAEQIMSWIKDPELKQFLGTIDPEKATAIQNMMITTSKDSARNSGGNLKSINDHSEKFIFNSKDGTFSLTAKAIADTRADAGFTKSLKTTLNKANSAVRVFLENKDAHPTLKDMTKEESLHWFLKGGAGAVPLSEDVTVVGTLSAPEQDKQEQIEAEQTNKEWQATKERIEFEASLPKQIATLKEEAKKARATVGQETTDLDDEEFEELIKQMRAERSGK